MSASGAIEPSEDWTRLNATAVVRSSIAVASLAAGTVTTSTPRASWTSQGKRFEVNSMSGTSTRAPGGSAAANGASRPEAVWPAITASTGAPTRRAKQARARSPAACHASMSERPSRHASWAAVMAAYAVSGGMPWLAVLSQPGSTLHRERARAGSRCESMSMCRP